jgi:hypothetical protein
MIPMRGLWWRASSSVEQLLGTASPPRLQAARPTLRPEDVEQEPPDRVLSPRLLPDPLGSSSSPAHLFLG